MSHQHPAYISVVLVHLASGRSVGVSTGWCVRPISVRRSCSQNSCELPFAPDVGVMPGAASFLNPCQHSRGIGPTRARTFNFATEIGFLQKIGFLNVGNKFKCLGKLSWPRFCKLQEPVWALVPSGETGDRATGSHWFLQHKGLSLQRQNGE